MARVKKVMTYATTNRTLGTNNGLPFLLCLISIHTLSNITFAAKI